MAARRSRIVRWAACVLLLFAAIANASLTQLLTIKARLVIPGHGPLSTDPATDLTLTRDYLMHLRKSMGDAARDLEPFDEAYAKTDWLRFEQMPLFKAVNRMNAYNTYLLMEQQAPR